MHIVEDHASKPGNSGIDRDCKNEKGFDYTLTVADNRKGISEEVDFQNPEPLELQLVNILVEQIDDRIELKRDHGTEFTIRYNNPKSE
ncbi:sensor histidine kinase [Methanosarcina sp. WWM596]|nr:sensor histidine kinase [Methanosarcina sp. WWM596]AKB23021.1 sensory transduction histidine kinase [Methanosarcina sp. WH1]